jgi:flagellar hook-associated protein 2
MGVSVSGIASGIDSDSIIAQLLAIEQRKIFSIQRKIAVEEMRRTSLDDLAGRLDSLRKAAQKFNNSTLYGKVNATSSDSSIVGIDPGPSAPVGTYQLEVLQTATNHRIAAQGFVDDSSTGIIAGDGTFSFQVGDEDEAVFDINGSTSLRDLATLINDGEFGVQADIVNDGSPLNPYRLVLTAKDSGSEGFIVITQNDSTLNYETTSIEAAYTDDDNSDDYDGAVISIGNYTGTQNTTFIMEVIADGAADGTAKYRLSTDGGLTFDDNGGFGFDVTSGGPIVLGDGVLINFEDNGTLREGDTFSIDAFNPLLTTPKNAIVRVNGIQISKSSNRITDVFDGLAFDLKSAEPGQIVSMTVTRDPGAVAEAVTAFVGAFNGVVGFLNSQFRFDPKSGGSPPALHGDSAARQVDRDLKGFISGRMPGLDGSTVSSMVELGLASNEKTGILSFSPMDLAEQLKEDPTSVERVLSRFGERVSGNFTFVRRTSKTEFGQYRVEVQQARTRAEVSAAAPAEALAANEVVTVEFDRNAQQGDGLGASINVALLAGDTPQQQVVRFQDAISNAGYELEVFLDAGGLLTFRSTEYGEDYAVDIISDTAAGAGTSQIGNVNIRDEGTELRGSIGGHRADVEGDHLEGPDGFETDGIDVIIPNDSSGYIGLVRIVDGAGERLPNIIRGLSGYGGIVKSRTEGVATRIEHLEEEIIKQERRIALSEQRLRRQFNNLEMSMGKLNALGDYVTQQLDAISSFSKRNKK